MPAFQSASSGARSISVATTPDAAFGQKFTANSRRYAMGHPAGSPFAPTALAGSNGSGPPDINDFVAGVAVAPAAILSTGPGVGAALAFGVGEIVEDGYKALYNLVVNNALPRVVEWVVVRDLLTPEFRRLLESGVPIQPYAADGRRVQCADPAGDNSCKKWETCPRTAQL